MAVLDIDLALSWSWLVNVGHIAATYWSHVSGAGETREPPATAVSLGRGRGDPETDQYSVPQPGDSQSLPSSVISSQYQYSEAEQNPSQPFDKLAECYNSNIAIGFKK